jgi:hypothetical protein
VSETDERGCRARFIRSMEQSMAGGSPPALESLRTRMSPSADAKARTRIPFSGRKGHAFTTLVLAMRSKGLLTCHNEMPTFSP